MYSNVCVCVCVAAPRLLDVISLTNSGLGSLRASWSKPFGDVDSYTLTLLQDRCVSLQDVSVALTACTLHIPCDPICDLHDTSERDAVIFNPA